MKTILLVDDDELFVDMVQRTLVRFGYNVILARDGVEALRIYDPQEVDLVLTDLVMPDKEGLGLIREIHAGYPAAKIIAMSGGGRNKPLVYLEAARHFGAMKVLAKPFSLDLLIKAIEECLEVPG